MVHVVNLLETGDKTLQKQAIEVLKVALGTDRELASLPAAAAKKSLRPVDMVSPIEAYSLEVLSTEENKSTFRRNKGSVPYQQYVVWRGALTDKIDSHLPFVSWLSSVRAAPVAQK
jgi:hypothetical protein